MLTPEQLGAIRKITDAATPGPWKNWGPRIESVVTDEDGPALIIYDEGGHTNEDAAFIVAARTYMPALLNEVERLHLRILDLEETCGIEQPER